MNKYRELLILLLLTVNQVYSSDWQGNWNSTFGEMKFIEQGINLHQAVLVFGSYGESGTIIGVSIAGKLYGTFFDQKTQKGGKLSFTKEGTSDDAQFFKGKWSFTDKELELSWNGTQLNNKKPISMNEADRYRSVEGQWSSNFGDLDLVQDEVFIKGTYSDKGKIFAIYNRTNQTLFGLFTNKQNFGLLDFSLTEDKKEFTGNWSWQAQNWQQQKWTGTRK